MFSCLVALCVKHEAWARFIASALGKMLPLNLKVKIKNLALDFFNIKFKPKTLALQILQFFTEKIAGLRWESNPHLHNSGVMLCQLSY